jgi:transposase, IS5 family
MRQERTIQASIFDLFATHEIGRELQAISRWLDQHRQLLGLISGDLRRDGVRQTGRHGLPAETVLRCALLKQYRQLSYEELAFHLEDSASFRAAAAAELDAEKGGAAEDHQCDHRGELEGDQSAAGERGAADQA